MALIKRFQFRRPSGQTLWAWIVLQVQAEVKPLWHRSKLSELNLRWRDTRRTDRTAWELRLASASSVNFKCPRCGLRACYMFADPGTYDRIEILGSFELKCRTFPRPDWADHCRAFMLGKKQVERSRPVTPLPHAETGKQKRNDDEDEIDRQVGVFHEAFAACDPATQPPLPKERRGLHSEPFG